MTLALGGATLLLIGCSAAGSSSGWTFGPESTGASASAPGVEAPAPGQSGTVMPSVAPGSAATTTLSFTPGTKDAPRLVELSADDLLNFTPGLVQAAVGETVTFRIHNKGTAIHEFMVGPLADAFADKEGTAEVADIGPDKTGSVTVTFDGSGPYAFACHAPGHFEHGMAGYIELVGPGAPAVGTAAVPRVVGLDMSDKLAFMPASIAVAKGETIRFVLSNSGTVTHEFQVGRADKVAADDVDGTIVVEQDALDEGSTHAVDYTFEGAGPFAFACHEPGHYEAGMKGEIILGE